MNSPTQSDKTVEEIVKNDLAYYGGSLSPEAIAALTARENRIRLDELNRISQLELEDIGQYTGDRIAQLKDTQEKG